MPSSMLHIQTASNVSPYNFSLYQNPAIKPDQSSQTCNLYQSSLDRDQNFYLSRRPRLQFPIWASAGLQAIANVFGQDLPAAETIPPAFVMSMRGAECKIAYMKLESLETDSFLRVKPLFPSASPPRSRHTNPESPETLR
jgi:hypothetical protein